MHMVEEMQKKNEKSRSGVSPTKEKAVTGKP